MRVVRTGVDRGALVQRVRLLRDLWGEPRRDWGRGVPASRALHRTLVAPLKDAGLLGGVRRLVVVPYGILGQVPFAALQDERTGRFLAQDVAIDHLPSAAALPALRRSAAPTGRSRDDLAGGAGFAPFRDALPATEAEVRAFQVSFPDAAVMVGARATEGAVRRALESDRTVHLATHGVLNARNPMFSRLQLARPRAPRPDDDGRLEVHEILTLRVRSALVFLSGCETGAAQEWTDDAVRGTGSLTLAQAVLSAGATDVISTLWRIDDAGAAAFAERFYRNLRRLPTAEALASAQRQTAADARYASPYYWAGYVLAGDGRLGAAQVARAASVP
jgi:CHAT domain-containing protein